MSIREHLYVSARSAEESGVTHPTPAVVAGRMLMACGSSRAALALCEQAREYLVVARDEELLEQLEESIRHERSKRLPKAPYLRAVK